jgi:hypothetical protein
VPRVRREWRARISTPRPIYTPGGDPWLIHPLISLFNAACKLYVVRRTIGRKPRHRRPFSHRNSVELASPSSSIEILEVLSTTTLATMDLEASSRHEDTRSDPQSPTSTDSPVESSYGDPTDSAIPEANSKDPYLHLWREAGAHAA